MHCSTASTFPSLAALEREGYQHFFCGVTVSLLLRGMGGFDEEKICCLYNRKYNNSEPYGTPFGISEGRNGMDGQQAPGLSLRIRRDSTGWTMNRLEPRIDGRGSKKRHGQCLQEAAQYLRVAVPESEVDSSLPISLMSLQPQPRFGRPAPPMIPKRGFLNGKWHPPVCVLLSFIVDSVCSGLNTFRILLNAKAIFYHWGRHIRTLNACLGRDGRTAR